MEHQEKKVPNLRFKEFTNDWEQYKLGEITIDMYNGQTPSRNNSEFWKGNIPWLTSGELNHDIITDTVEKITKLGQKDKHLRLIKKGTFVIAITGLEAPGTRGNCALLGIDTTINQSVMAIYPDHKKVTSDFLFDWYEKVGTEYGITYTQGTKQQSYNVNLLSTLPIMITHNLKEQYKISQLLKITNRLISLQQRKLDLLKQLKKGLLQQEIIKKAILNKPTSWILYKLEDLLKVRKKLREPNVDYPLSSFTADKGVTPKTARYDRKFLVRTNNKKYKVTEYNDIVYNPANLKFGAIALNKFGKATISPIYETLVSSCNCDIHFLSLIVTSQDFIHKVLKFQEGTVYERMAVKVNDFLSMSIKLPAFNEQQKLGKYFAKIDSLIAFHQRKLDQIELIKKFLLQKMFI
jgi:type I restriction enzyme S subunit